MPPPDFHLFHVNLQRFGGVSRVDEIAGEMAEVCQQLGVQNRVLAAGFTEVTNCRKSVQALERIAVALDPGLRETYVIACGHTVGGKYGPIVEYLGVSLFQTDEVRFRPSAIGKVLPQGDGYSQQITWECFPCSEMLPLSELPRDSRGRIRTKPDVRGVAYVVGEVDFGTNGRQPLVIGFMHNMFNTGERTLYYTALGSIHALICRTHGVDSRTPSFFGGDFNLPPRKTGTARTGGLYCIYAEREDHSPIPTTRKNPYDFWLTNIDGFENNLAGVWLNLRADSGGPSDHAAISMKVPFEEWPEP